MEEKEIKEAGKTNKQKKKEEKAFQKKILEVAERKERLQDMKDEKECAEHREKEKAADYEKWVGRFKKADEEKAKNTVDGNLYAANLPEHHMNVKAETWQWKTGAVKA